MRAGTRVSACLVFLAVGGAAGCEESLTDLESTAELAGAWTTVSDGALIVDLSAHGIDTPCLLQKSDGATLYATRDIAAAKFRHERFGGTALTRTDDPRDLSSEDRFDIILHCAINTRDRPEGDGLYRFVNDNLLLTDRLLDLPHAVFVHVSSVDVYPKNDAEHTETEALSLDMPGTPYGTRQPASSGRKLVTPAFVMRGSSRSSVTSRP